MTHRHPAERVAAAALACALVLTALPVPRAGATGIPVVDPASIAERAIEHTIELVTMNEELMNAIATLEKAKQSYERLGVMRQRLEDQIALVKGVRSFPELVALLERIFDLFPPPVHPEDIEGIVDGNGGSEHEAATRRIQELREHYDLIPAAVLSTTQEGLSAGARSYKQYHDDNFYLMYAAEVLQASAEERQQAYQTFLAKSEKPDDIKKSADLANKIAVKNGTIMNELLNQHTLLTKVIASQNADELSDLSRVARSSGLGVQ